MDKYAPAGAKKLLSLARTKIRLAEEAQTVECMPSPLPLVKRLSGASVSSIGEARAYRDELASNTSFTDENSIASAVLQCMDIIEGVKYKYEPPKYMPNIDWPRMRQIEAQAGEEGCPVYILLMTKTSSGLISLFIGEDPPVGAIFLSGVPTSLAPFVEYAFGSDYFSASGRLRNLRCVLGHRTLIINAIYNALGVYGAALSEER